MSIVYKTDGFILVDHGYSLVTSRENTSFIPTPGLFHQPKQYFKTREHTEDCSLRDLFASIEYPSPTADEAIKDDSATSISASERPCKKRKVRSYSKNWNWLNSGTVLSHKNSTLAQQCTKCKLNNVLEFPVKLYKSLSSSTTQTQKLTNMAADLHLKSSGLFNKYVSNDAARSIIVKSDENSYIIPPNSSFLMTDICHVNSLLTFAPPSKFHFIVMDPPWSNKSVKRSKHYSMLSTQSHTSSDSPRFGKQRKYEEVGYMFYKIDLPGLLRQDGLLAIWVTNNTSHVQHILNVLFPLWNLHLITVCFWLKVTIEGTPVVPFNSPHKKPYELLLVGKRTTVSALTDRLILTSQEIDDLVSFPRKQLEIVKASGATDSSECKIFISSKNLSDEVGVSKLILASVPCIQHSRKPPLGFLYSELRKTYCTQTTPESEGGTLNGSRETDPHFLELFARSLNRNWISWGNEVLLFQNTEFFEEDVIDEMT